MPAPALRLALVQAVYLALFGAAVWLWLRRAGGGQAIQEGLICALPVLGATALLFTSAEDQMQYVLRVMACALFGPVLLLFWSSGAARAGRVWPFVTSAAVLHGLAFAGTVLWAGTAMTRVSADPSAARVSPERLVERLLSLNSAGAPFEAVAGAHGELTVWYRFPAGEARSHAVILRIDAEGEQVRVRERLSASGARPRTSSEASMRGPGDPYFDPSRPQASRVYGTVAQTSPISSESLRAVPLEVRERSLAVPPGFASRLDEDGMVTLLCAAVTRSGWNWQPEFFAND